VIFLPPILPIMIFRDRICGYALLAIGVLGGVAAYPRKTNGMTTAPSEVDGLPVVDLQYALQRATSYNVSYYNLHIILV
jgi:hypothetical protein